MGDARRIPPDAPSVYVSRSVEETRRPEMGKLSPLPSTYDLVSHHRQVDVVGARRGQSRPPKVSSHQTCMGLFLSSGCFGFAVSSLFGAGRRFFVPSPGDQVRGARGRGQGTETLAQLGGLPPSVACVSQRLDARARGGTMNREMGLFRS